jgi:3-oxoacyl-[acyl-carrier protein] reductase
LNETSVFAGVHVLLLGATRGLGLRLWAHFAQEGGFVTAVGRNQPIGTEMPKGNFVQADLSKEDGLSTVYSLIRSNHFDCVAYVAGIWEADGFARAAHTEIDNIIRTNLLAPLQIGQELLLCTGPAATRTHYILIGSTCGLENEGSSSAAYVSSKFGLRGLAHALRESARGRPLYVTCISPGSILDPVMQSSSPETRRIPAKDIYQLVRCILSMSENTLLKEIVMPAFDDRDV